MVFERSIEISVQQALLAHTIKKDRYENKNFKKGQDKGGNW